MRKAVIISLLIVLCGCASRKTNTDISKTSQKDKIETSQSGKVESESETKSSESIVDQKDKEKIETTTKVKEILNPDGSVKERTTTTSNKKSTDKSKKTVDRKVIISTYFIYRYRIHFTREITKTIKIKTKAVSSNNYGWIAFALVVIYLVYIKFKTN